MRLLHTSDWHLGRSLHSVPMLEHQGAFLDWLVRTVDEREVDCVVVAGDVFDRAVPPLEAVGAFESALERLSALCQVVLVPGNHDSPVRLGFASGLLERAGVHIRSTVDDISRPVAIVSPDGSRTAVYGIPFLHPDLHHAQLESGRTHEAVMSAAMERVRDDLVARGSDRSVVVAHAFVTGAQSSDSERDVSVGGIADVPAHVFHGVDYVALGHLHRPQQVPAPDAVHVRYSGSPLPYSFSEEGVAKGVVLVDLPAVGPVTCEFVPCPVPRSLATITGTLQELLDDGQWAAAEGCWVRAVLTDARRPDDAMERLRARFPFAIDLVYRPASPDGGSGGSRPLDIPAADPVDVAVAFVEYATGSPADDAERRALQAAVDAARLAEVGS